jgi:vitellogenic carboxypeptidase-like protein
VLKHAPDVKSLLMLVEVCFLFSGFSFTEDERGYATEQVQVGAELYSAITQFLVVFPELQSVAFYITGESYAGRLDMNIILVQSHNFDPTIKHFAAESVVS